MCGLFGYINHGGVISSNTLYSLLQQLAIGAASRGTDATGIAYNQNNRHVINKAPVPAHQFNFNLPKNAMPHVVMGHTRRTTQGTERKNHNNHPFEGTLRSGKRFSLAHNGVLDNDYNLRKEEDLPKTSIETDSYVAVQLVEKYCDSLSAESLVTVAQKVSGMFAFTLLDDRNNFYIVKNDSPFYMIYSPKYRLYIYASTKDIVNDALKEAEIDKYSFDAIPVEQGEIIEIPFNGKQIKKTTFEINNAYYNYYNPKYAIANASNYLSAYNELYSALASYGLSDDEIDLLLLYYDAAAIWDFIDAGKVHDILLECLRTEFHLFKDYTFRRV